MERTRGFKERRYIEELRIITKSTAIDCVIDDDFDRIIYVVKKGDMGIAIGKRGDNIKKMEKILGKRIEMVEQADTPEEFIVNILKPAEISRIAPDEHTDKVNIIVKKKNDLGIAIGKGGSNIEKVRILCKRFFNMNIGDIRIEGGDYG
jgi:N utilization substance protein A